MNVLVSLSDTQTNFPLKGQTNFIYTTELQRGKRWRGNVWFYSISRVKGKPLWEISVSRVSRRNTMKVISVSMNDNNKRLNSNQLKWSSSGKYETRNYINTWFQKRLNKVEVFNLMANSSTSSEFCVFICYRGINQQDRWCHNDSTSCLMIRLSRYVLSKMSLCVLAVMTSDRNVSSISLTSELNFTEQV